MKAALTADEPRQEEAVGRLRDFPEFLGPMAVKELRQGVRAKAFVVPFLGVQVAMLIALGADYSAHLGASGAMRLFFNPPIDGLGAQGAFWNVAFLLMLLVTPVAGLGTLSREREGRNGELLLLAGLSRWRVVLGKWAVLCALGMLTAMTMLPYLLVRYFMGGMNVPLTLMLALALVILNATANALAIGLSGYPGIGTRVTVGLCMAVAMYLCSAIVSLSTGYAMGSLFGMDKTALIVLGGLLGVAATCLLFSSFGLQLGRIRIRPYERPMESATSGGVVALIILSPIILGFAAIITMGYAAILGALLFAWAVLVMDPSPEKRAAIRSKYARACRETR